MIWTLILLIGYMVTSVGYLKQVYDIYTFVLTYIICVELLAMLSTGNIYVFWSFDLL